MHLNNLTIHEYLQNTPKDVLTSLHRRFVKSTGILNNARIIPDLTDAICNPQRLLNLSSLNLDSWTFKCVQMIYASGYRGLTTAEILSCTPRDHQTELQTALQELCEEFVLYRTAPNAQTAYFGFSELTQNFKLDLEPATESKGKAFVANQQITWHLALCCKSIILGNLQLTTTNELHKRSQKLLDDLISLRNTLCISEERTLLLQFLSDQDLLKIQGQTLYIPESAWNLFNKNSNRVRNLFMSWWVNSRFQLSLEQFKVLLKELSTTTTITSLSARLWPLLPETAFPSIENEVRFDTLPRLLKELWVMGFVEINIDKGKCSEVRLTSNANTWINIGLWETELESQNLSPKATPNFDIFVPTSSRFTHLILVSCFAEPQNDEAYLCLKIQKELFLQTLKVEIPILHLNETLQWLNLPENVGQACAEWRHIHEGSWLCDKKILRIHNLETWNELANFPHFLKHVEEVIPNWGFIVNPHAEEAVRTLLSQFGLVPPTPKSSFQINELYTGWNKDFSPPIPPKSPVDYQLKDPALAATATSAILGTALYSKDFQKLDPAQILKILRYALVMEIELEAILKDAGKNSTKCVRFHVQRINQRREPLRIIAWDSNQVATEFGIDQVVQIRLT